MHLFHHWHFVAMAEVKVWWCNELQTISLYRCCFCNKKETS